MDVFNILTILTSLFSTSRGQFPDLGFGFDLYQVDLPVTLPHVTNNTRWDDVTHALLEQVAANCGWSRLCNTTDWKDLYKEERCSACLECRCDQLCYERGDCCVDKVLEDLSEQHVLETPPPTPPRYTCHSTVLTSFRVPQYAYMIDTCPETFYDKNGVVERCYNASLSSVEGHWPVISRSTKSVYRNVYCATCNNDHGDIVKWDVRFQCLDNMHLVDTSSQGAIIHQIMNVSDCQISFVTPRGYLPDTCAPVTDTDVISTCNATGQRMTYDSLLWKACQTFQSYVTGTYLNVFCAMCNSERLNLKGMCPSDFPFPFVLVMSADALSKVTSQRTERCICRDDEMYDVYEKKCQKLHCSMTRQLVDKKCLPLFGNSTGLAYDVAVRLTPDDGTSLVPLDSSSSLEQVARNIRTAFLLGASSDSGWDVQMDYFRVIAQAQGSSAEDKNSLYQSVPLGGGAAINVSSFLVRLKFATRWTEPPENLERRLLRLIHIPWNVSIGKYGKLSFASNPLYIQPVVNSTQTFETVTVYSSSENVTEYVIDMTDTPSYWQASMQVGIYVPVKATLSCPRVFLSLGYDTSVEEDQEVNIDAETGDVHHKASGRHVMFEYTDVVENKGVYVCADKLFETMDPDVVSATSVFPPALVYASLVCQSVSAVCLVLSLLTFCLLPSLRTLPGLNTMGLIVTLLLTTLLFELGVAGVDTPATPSSNISCVVVGVMIHFCLLSSFTWMVVCTVHMYRVFSHVITSRLDHSGRITGKFLLHLIISVVVPAVIVACTILANYLTSDHECWLDLGYGRGICYLSNLLSLILASILPVGLAVGINLVLFARTLLDLCRLSQERRDMTERQHQQLAIYAKLSTLTGINWLVGLVAAAVDSVEVWYAFLVLCGLQGFYVFVAFVCNRRVWMLYRDMIARCCKGKGGGSRKATSSTERQHGNGWTNSSSNQRLHPSTDGTKSSSLSQYTPQLISNTKL